MTITQELGRLVDQLPDPDDRGMYTKGIDKDRIESVIASLFAGGRENVQGLIEMLGEPGSDANVKPHYALHCVLNHTLIVKDEGARREFAAVMASNLAGNLSTYNKAYLCQELQWMGREEVVEPLGQLLLDETLVEPASMALVAIKTGAAIVLRAALPEATGKCRLSVVDALAALADADSIKDLIAALQDDDPEVRIAARAGLAKLPDRAAASAVTQSCGETRGWERLQAAKSCLVAAETLAAAGKKEDAAGIYEFVASSFAGETETHVRDAARAGKARLPG